jgi:hypothetical protein
MRGKEQCQRRGGARHACGAGDARSLCGRCCAGVSTHDAFACARDARPCLSNGFANSFNQQQLQVVELLYCTYQGRGTTFSKPQTPARTRRHDDAVFSTEAWLFETCSTQCVRFGFLLSKKHLQFDFSYWVWCALHARRGISQYHVAGLQSETHAAHQHAAFNYTRAKLCLVQPHIHLYI